MKVYVVGVLLAVIIGGESKRRRSGEPFLKILPSGNQEVRAGKNLVLTCKAQVPNPDLVKDLKWFHPNGIHIRQDERVYSEEQPGEAATALFIKNVGNKDAGQYRCTATYASNQELSAAVRIEIFVGITWEDAPESQYAGLGDDYKIKCKVRALPPANIDWLKESLIISTGDQYVIESDGLVIQNVNRDNAGTYTCRARVPETGELEEKDIQLDVQEPPRWVQKPFNIQGVELEKVEFLCEAIGSPHPKYTWLDRDGLDATEKLGWKLNENSGTLTAFKLRRQDAGEYTCIAENNAGREEAKANLNVIILPKVQELYNKTYPIGKMGAELTCKASGDPLPRIVWRKWSRNEPFLTGGQPEDSRIIVMENTVEAFLPEYTEGERTWMQSTVVIEGLKRSDDGLYECMAENEGGRFFKSGHITVEFPPSFEDQPHSKEWSWDQRPVNLTCIARSIPNATISWWHSNLEIGRDDLDKNFQIHGHGPTSDLVITPLVSSYYRNYQCKAENPHGVAFHDIELEEAHEPGELQQAVLDKSTATTLQFRFIPPTNIGGIPIDSYAVEYKPYRLDWSAAHRRVWPVDTDGSGYILENLQPETIYDLRFGSKNRVGFSPWGAPMQITTPKRGRPETPILNIQTGPGQVLDGDVIALPSSNNYEVSWQIPEDNGVQIDFFQLTYFPVRRENSLGGEWVRVGEITKEEIPHRGNVRWGLKLQYQDTFYQVELRAHNGMGFSAESALIVKTAKDKTRSHINPPTQPTLNSAPVASPLLPLLPLLAALLQLTSMISLRKLC